MVYRVAIFSNQKKKKKHSHGLSALFIIYWPQNECNVNHHSQLVATIKTNTHKSLILQKNSKSPQHFLRIQKLLAAVTFGRNNQNKPLQDPVGTEKCNNWMQTLPITNSYRLWLLKTWVRWLTPNTSACLVNRKMDLFSFGGGVISQLCQLSRKE